MMYLVIAIACVVTMQLIIYTAAVIATEKSYQEDAQQLGIAWPSPRIDRPQKVGQGVWVRITYRDGSQCSGMFHGYRTFDTRESCMGLPFSRTRYGIELLVPGKYSGGGWNHFAFGGDIQKVENIDEPAGPYWL